MLLSPFLVSGNTRGREAPEPSLPLGYEDKAGHHCARPPPAGFTVCSSHITGGNAETWVMMWERAFPGADVGFPNRRTRGWVIEAHALSSHSKGNLHDGVRNSTTAGESPCGGGEALMKDRTREPCLDSYKGLGSQGTHNCCGFCPQPALSHTVEPWLGG